MIEGQLIVISGPSGVGKDTVAKALVAQSPEEYTISVSATSRPPRASETEGTDYFFLSREQFENRIAKGDFLEYAQYNGNYYGTPKENVFRQRAAGKNVILVIEVEGAGKLRTMGPDALMVFLMPPSWQALKTRLERRRTESAGTMEQRLVIAKKEIARAKDYDFIIINDELERCTGQLREIISAARYKAWNQRDFIREVLEDA